MLRKVVYRRWRSSPPSEDGYAAVLAIPMDMPFLLRLALEGFARIDASHCRQIIVVPDGFAKDGGRGLQDIIHEFDDTRIEMARVRYLDAVMMRRSSVAHWVCVVCGTEAARCRHIFLHDADAFFVDVDAVDRLYRSCRDASFDALGVEPRWDPFFQRLGYRIPGTWQMMYATDWLRNHPPYRVYGQLEETPHGPHVFDTLLYPQYLDYRQGKVGVMDKPPRFIHFHGSIVTFRLFCRSRGRTVVDEMYRLLLLALLHEAVHDGSCRLLPSVELLARGLTDADAPVSYGSEVATRGYAEFRRCLKDLCDTPVFRGQRAERMAELIQPFDDHFRRLSVESPERTRPVTPRMRHHGLKFVER